MASHRFTLAAVAWMALIGTAYAEEGVTLKIATEGAFPPWNAVDASGQIVGFDIDVGKALCERAELRCAFVTQAWDGIIPALNVGKYDAIMAGMSITEKRKQVIAFTEPYASTSNYFLVAKASGFPALPHNVKINLSQPTDSDTDLLQTLKNNFQGKIVGVQGSTNAELFVREFLGGSVDIRTYDTQDNLNLDLSTGRIDAGLADYSVWDGFLESDGGRTVELYGPQVSGGPFGPGVGIGVRKDNLSLVKRFNDALVSIKADGTLKAISGRWFNADLSAD